VARRDFARYGAAASTSARRASWPNGELAVEATCPPACIDERTGTIVIGKDVQIFTWRWRTALTVGDRDSQGFSSPARSHAGETGVTPRPWSRGREGRNIAIVRGTNLQAPVSGLNRIGLKPWASIAILQAIKYAGALQADLVVQ